MMAAIVIRDVAKKEGHVEVADQKVHTIKLAMRVALRRFGVSRPEREEKAELPGTSSPPPLPAPVD